MRDGFYCSTGTIILLWTNTHTQRTHNGQHTTGGTTDSQNLDNARRRQMTKRHTTTTHHTRDATTTRLNTSTSYRGLNVSGAPSAMGKQRAEAAAAPTTASASVSVCVFVYIFSVYCCCAVYNAVSARVPVAGRCDGVCV